MPTKLNKRDDTQRLIYFDNPDPATRPHAPIAPGDVWLTFRDSDGALMVQIRNEINDGWELFDWTAILNKPDRFDPKDHPVSPSALGSRHTGKLDVLKDTKNYNVGNRVETAGRFLVQAMVYRTIDAYVSGEGG